MYWVCIFDWLLHTVVDGNTLQKRSASDIQQILKRQQTPQLKNISVIFAWNYFHSHLIHFDTRHTFYLSGTHYENMKQNAQKQNAEFIAKKANKNIEKRARRQQENRRKKTTDKQTAFAVVVHSHTTISLEIEVR